MILLFVIVIAGFICGKTRLMNKGVSQGLSSLIVSLTCPCLVMASTMGDKMPDRSLILPLLLVSALTYTILLVVSVHLPRLMGCPEKERGLYSFMLTFGNVGFIGYPVIAAMFGAEAVFYASVLNVANTITVFIWGAQFIAGKGEGGSLRSRLYSPAMIGTYLSIIIVALQWHAPHFLAQPVKMIGDVTVPTSLLIIGYSISQIPARHMAGGRRHFLMAAFRLFILPLSICYLFRSIVWMLPMAGMVFDPLIININTMLIAMPVASFGTIFCLKYGVDETVMAQGTFLTTLLSMITIPFVAGLL